MNNENTSITTLTGQGDTFPSRYSSPSAGKREGIMKHTKGKWTASIGDRGATIQINNDFNHPLSFDLKFPDKFAQTELHEEAVANANLIASAPEMLEALLQINNLELDDSFGDHKIALLDWAKKVGKIARTAIAKAEGSHTDEG